ENSVRSDRSLAFASFRASSCSRVIGQGSRAASRRRERSQSSASPRAATKARRSSPRPRRTTRSRVPKSQPNIRTLHGQTKRGLSAGPPNERAAHRERVAAARCGLPPRHMRTALTPRVKNRLARLARFRLPPLCLPATLSSVWGRNLAGALHPGGVAPPQRSALRSSGGGLARPERRALRASGGGPFEAGGAAAGPEVAARPGTPLRPRSPRDTVVPAGRRAREPSPSRVTR